MGGGGSASKGSSAGASRGYKGVMAIEVTMKDGTKTSYRSYRSGGGGIITGIDDSKESIVSGKMTIPEIAKRMKDSGASVKTYTKKQLAEHDKVFNRANASKPDYQLGYGLGPGGSVSKGARRTARVNRLENRAMKKR